MHVVGRESDLEPLGAVVRAAGHVDEHLRLVDARVVDASCAVEHTP
ncbi:MAG: hypothetical protein QOF92_1171 [Pseudonocardiales bacterium]|nr:hypothetical protein [Pseudonocardiales bacterium]